MDTKSQNRSFWIFIEEKRLGWAWTGYNGTFSWKIICHMWNIRSGSCTSQYSNWKWIVDQKLIFPLFILLFQLAEWREFWNNFSIHIQLCLIQITFTYISLSKWSGFYRSCIIFIIWYQRIKLCFDNFWDFIPFWWDFHKIDNGWENCGIFQRRI